MLKSGRGAGNAKLSRLEHAAMNLEEDQLSLGFEIPLALISLPSCTRTPLRTSSFSRKIDDSSGRVQEQAHARSESIFRCGQIRCRKAALSL